MTRRSTQSYDDDDDDDVHEDDDDDDEDDRDYDEGGPAFESPSKRPRVSSTRGEGGGRFGFRRGDTDPWPLLPATEGAIRGGGDDGGGGDAYDDGSGDDEVVVTSSNATNPNVGYPHSSHRCGVHPFIVVVVAPPQPPLSTNPSWGRNVDHRNSNNDNNNANNNNDDAAFCPRCYCYVYDAPASACVRWADDHCHAHDGDEVYARRRETTLSD